MDKCLYKRCPHPASAQGYCIFHLPWDRKDEGYALSQAIEQLLKQGDYNFEGVLFSAWL